MTGIVRYFLFVVRISPLRLLDPVEPRGQRGMALPSWKSY